VRYYVSHRSYLTKQSVFIPDLLTPWVITNTEVGDAMKIVSSLLLTTATVFLLSGCFSRTPNIDKPNSDTDLKAIEIGEMDQWGIGPMWGELCA